MIKICLYHYNCHFPRIYIYGGLYCNWLPHWHWDFVTFGTYSVHVHVSIRQRSCMRARMHMSCNAMSHINTRSISLCDQLRSPRLACRSAYRERPTAREMRPYQSLLPLLLACSCLVFPTDGEGEPSTTVLLYTTSYSHYIIIVNTIHCTCTGLLSLLSL